MNKDTISFIILCVFVVLAVLGVYLYNNHVYRTQSSMVIVPVMDTSSSHMEYIISDIETTIPTVSTSVVDINTTITSITNINTTTDATTTIITTTSTSTQNTTTTKPTEKIVNFPISLNTATHEELVCIKGIGDVTAQKIIEYRDSIGGFTSRYQLLEIKGIGESKMNTIMEYTYIENEILEYNQEPKNESQQEVINNENGYPQEQENNIYEDTPIEEPQPTIEFPINLNTATLEELCYIPNVDETIAQEILNLRDTIQYYSNPYELLYIDSISESFLSEIIQYVYVE